MLQVEGLCWVPHHSHCSPNSSLCSEMRQDGWEPQKAISPVCTLLPVALRIPVVTDEVSSALCCCELCFPAPHLF